ncbi:hypothetical protein [Kribbella sp. NPDC023855]|uniref:hypothetical protein n=1 Tax=Kribbella sp. NPDC023855 TaxID=3154698 RepID=UPI00340F08EC
MPRTRAGAAWVGICAGAVLGVFLIIFIFQNTRKVTVSFLWMDGSVPLALALLVTALTVGLVTMAIGTVRLAQLRRLVRYRRPTASKPTQPPQ